MGVPIVGVGDGKARVDFILAGDRGCWWTATVRGGSSNDVYFWYILDNKDEVSEFLYSMKFGLSVRCVGDESDGGKLPTYAVTVSSAGTNSSGGGSYTAGTVVTISAGAAPSGYAFSAWTTASGGVTFNSANSAATWFTMPANAVTVTANFRQNSVTPPGGGGSYESVVIGGVRWMSKNLNIETGTSWCYGEGGQVYGGERENLSSAEIQANCDKYGRLYDWSTALTVCPDGWHLPSREEWDALAIAAGRAGPYGTEGTDAVRLKSRSGWYNDGNGTDDFGFSALPGGQRNAIAGNVIYTEEGSTGIWWTATTTRLFNAVYTMTIFYVGNGIVETSNGKSNGTGSSVRCVAD